MSKSTKQFDLDKILGRKEYFDEKIPSKIENLRKFLKSKNFVAFLVAKKGAGKGTYTKIFTEAFGTDGIEHISVGDLIRNTEMGILEGRNAKKELISWLDSEYKGEISTKDALEILTHRDTKSLLPTDLIISLLKREILAKKESTLFIDGFPRDIDQIPKTKELLEVTEVTDAPDFFVTIEIPEEIIDLRIKHRVTCPVCGNPRNLLFNSSEHVKYDEGQKEFYFECDNPSCSRNRMVRKEGDEKGIEYIRERLNQDAELIEHIKELPDADLVQLYNHVELSELGKSVEDYELTSKTTFSIDPLSGEIIPSRERLVIKDDFGNDVYSLRSAPVAKQMFSQISDLL